MLLGRQLQNSDNIPVWKNYEWSVGGMLEGARHGAEGERWRLSAVWRQGNADWHDGQGLNVSSLPSQPNLALAGYPASHEFHTQWRSGESGPTKIKGLGAFQEHHVEKKANRSGWRDGDRAPLALDGSEVARPTHMVPDQRWRAGEDLHFERNKSGVALGSSQQRPHVESSADWRMLDHRPVPLAGGERNHMQPATQSNWRYTEDTHLSAGFGFGQSDPRKPGRGSAQEMYSSGPPVPGLFSAMGRPNQIENRIERGAEWRQGEPSDDWPPSPPKARVARLHEGRGTADTGPASSYAPPPPQPPSLPRSPQGLASLYPPQKPPMYQQPHADAWRWSTQQSAALPAGSPIKTLQNAGGRKPPESSVDFRLVYSDLNVPREARNHLAGSQSLPTMVGAVKAENEQHADLYNKLEEQFLPVPRHGRRRPAGIMAHANSTVHP